MLSSYKSACELRPQWHKAWHAWALANFNTISYFEKKLGSIPQNLVIAHVAPAINAFFRAISLSLNDSLQSTLRLLTLWFKYGDEPDVQFALSDGFGNVRVDTWLAVIPQV